MWLWRVHATSVVLALALATRHEWLRPLLVANAVVGFAHMHLEREAFATTGTVVGPWTFRWTYAQNPIVNLVAHVALTYVALARLDAAEPRPGATLALEAAGLLVLDLTALYPTVRHPLDRYAAAHAALVVAQVLTPKTSPGGTQRG
jgi:hypothetical protein